MKKTDKKKENALRQCLTGACDNLQEQSEGFIWLTHSINYDNYPQSLCVYGTNEQMNSIDCGLVYQVINKHLSSIGIQLKNREKHIHLDSEEACIKEHDGKWSKRLSQHN
ncbi:hypothetical protein L0B53_11850 [Vibrio sp. SS-MA-C1-2]|uniref:hypothetical protein n=1 Tax=Vibrio sp. SS-MA-C1-2 TaxID=2908646 RepID=UPI001F245347|nr:hypothetical protein [Vibrio sp. SS-MA-C1-2]UJF17723.1 hypothetical protein L0B53_11850 [Vibrio sp. SS-MA-C1-2]